MIVPKPSTRKALGSTQEPEEKENNGENGGETQEPKDRHLLYNRKILLLNFGNNIKNHRGREDLVYYTVI